MNRFKWCALIALAVLLRADVAYPKTHCFSHSSGGAGASCKCADGSGTGTWTYVPANSNIIVCLLPTEVPDVDFGLLSTSVRQKMHLQVLNTSFDPDNACQVALRFVDGTGRVLAQAVQDLQSGEGTSLSLARVTVEASLARALVFVSTPDDDVVPSCSIVANLEGSAAGIPTFVLQGRPTVTEAPPRIAPR